MGPRDQGATGAEGAGSSGLLMVVIRGFGILTLWKTACYNRARPKGCAKDCTKESGGLMVEVPDKIYVTNLAKKAREAARPLSLLPTRVKDEALVAMADRLEAKEDEILEANERDLEAIGKSQPTEANKDRVKEGVERVRLTSEAIQELAKGLRAIADLPDPVAEVTGVWRRPNGIQVSRVRVPIGVIGVISELGPKVTLDMVGLCLKSGNVCVIRLGADWMQTNLVIGKHLREAAEGVGVPVGALSFVERPERDAALELIRLPKCIDAIIPRGGAGLRKVVLEQSRVPVLCHDGGICFLYVDGDADLPLAQNMVVNSKVQQATAVNAIDTLLVHQSIARSLVPGLVRRLLDDFKVEVRGDPKTITLTGAVELSSYKSVKEATEEDWSRQFLTPVLAMKMVKDMDEALDHIAAHGPSNTASIVTRDYETAMRFSREVDASAVFVNASTRFHEGQELGIGPAVGYSTARLHIRGPVTLEDLTCQRYLVLGTGQLRQPHPVPTAYEDAIMLKRPS